MLKKLNRTTKIAILGVGAVCFAGLAYKAYTTRQVKQIIQSQHPIHNTATHTNINTNKSIQSNTVQANNKDNNNGNGQNKQKGQHHHDMDIRVLDMVGYPSVHGANILQPEHHQHKNQNKQLNKQQQLIQNKENQVEEKKQAQQSADDKKVQQKQSKQSNSTTQINQQPKQKQNNSAQLVQTVQTVQDLHQVHPQQSKQQQIQSSKQQSIPKAQQLPKAQQKIKSGKRKTYTKISQIPKLDFEQKFDKDDYVVIVVDLPYNQAFQTQIINKLSNTIKRRFANTPLKIYRANISDPHVKQHIQDKLGANVQQQTILFMKNPYQDKFINFDFDLYVKHNTLPSIYLSQLRIAQNKQQLQKLLTKMTPNDTFLLFIIDSSVQGELNKKKLTAKYIQMEMGVNNIQNIKVLVLDQKLAKQNGIVEQDTKPNSLHLLRKSNQFTYKPPNRRLFGQKPFLLIENISLYDKTRNMMIPKYLSRVQTFNSVVMNSPYALSLTIDRNKISPKQQRQILHIFAKLKQSQHFPQVSFVLKFGQTQYRGAKQQPFANKKWCLKLANLDQLDKQLLIHDIKKIDDLQALGITQQKWQRDTYQYLYREPEITTQGVQNFITRCVNGQQQQFYKTQAKFKLQGVHKLTGDTFNKAVFEGDQNRSHLVFQYSDHCQACQILSPVIQHFSYVCKKFPTIGTDVHAINCDKNRVKGQQYSPYTPNLYFYSKNWKNIAPLRYPVLQFIIHTNVWGIYDFCTITDDLKKVDLNKFNEHIKNIMDANIKLTDF